MMVIQIDISTLENRNLNIHILIVQIHMIRIEIHDVYSIQ